MSKQQITTPGVIFAFGAGLLTAIIWFAADTDPSAAPLAAVGLLVLAIAPLLGEMQWPTTLTALGVTMVAAIAYLAFEVGPYPAIFPAALVGLFLAAQQSRSHAVAMGIGAAIVVYIGIAAWSGDEFWSLETLGDTTLFLLPVAAGDAVRMRRVAAEHAEVTRAEFALRQVHEERLRIARELHDSLTHTISTVNVQAGVAAHVATDESPQVIEAFAAIRSASAAALDELRSVLHVLRDDGSVPLTADPKRTIHDLADLVDGERRNGLALRTVELGPYAVEPSPHVGATVWLILREALTNAGRHAPGTPVDVVVSTSTHQLTLNVRNPTGEASTEATGTGLGLVGVRERCEALGGQCHVSEIDGVFDVLVTIPLTQRERP